MKKMLLLFMPAVLFFSACSKDDNPEKDNEKPSIQINSDLPDSLFGGDTLIFDLRLRDNQELSQVKFEIHDNFDGHSHKKGGVLPFIWDSIINLSGTSMDLNLPLVLPVDIAAGNYDIIIQALDKSGNEADFYATTIYLQNPLDTEAPQIQNLSHVPLSVSGIINISSAGDSLHIYADISDNLALDKVELVIESESTKAIVYDYDEEAPSSNYSFKHSIRFDASWSAGDYHLHLKVVDIKGNITEEELEINYTP